MKIFKKASALLLASTMAFSLAACGGKTNAPESGGSNGAAANDKMLIIGVEGTFEEKWNPFLADGTFDRYVLDQVFAPVMQVNAENVMQDYAGSCTYEEQEDGSVLYTIKINEGMKFHDGEPVTVDDYIYGYYVRTDPSYTGPQSTLQTFIEGINEYYYDDPNFTAAVEKIAGEVEAKYTTETISFEDFLIFVKETNMDGMWSGDPTEEIAPEMTWLDYIKEAGLEKELAAIDDKDADAVLELVARAEFENSLSDYDTASWWTKRLEAEIAQGNLEDGIDVEEITGITRVDDYTCTIKYTKMDIFADRALTRNSDFGLLIPAHYYGEFEKGDVSGVVSNLEPMGSGPYKWNGYKDQIVTGVANDEFFLGQPKIGTVRWQYVLEADIVTKLAAGDIDISVPSASKQNITEMDAQGIRYDLIDNAGYGYLGMNTENLTQNERKAILSLMNREPSVEGYYGEGESALAKVIERPMSTVVAEYPQDAKPFYEYSREKALEYFEAAGYTQVDGKLVDANGVQFVTNVYIGGDGEGNHPSYPMLVQAAEDLKALGGELQINDTNFTVMSSAKDDGTADMWCMAWSEVFVCDKSAQFHSNGGQNYYRLADPKMDEYLDTILMTIDFDERKELVSEMLDYATDLGVEYPVYQRKNAIAYNEAVVDMSTVPESTSFYNYASVLWQLDVNA